MMRNLLKRVDRSLELIEDWSLFIAVAIALLVAMANVVLRKTTSISLYWSDEVVRKVIFFTTYIGCSAALRERALIRIDALPQIIRGLKKPLSAVSHLAVLVFAVFMIRYGWTMTLSAWSDPFARTSTLQIPEWYFYAVLPLLGGMLLLRTLLLLLKGWYGFPVK